MKGKKFVLIGTVVLLFAFLLSGCGGYGKLRALAGQEKALTVEVLEKNWRDYTVYWTGLSVGEPSGIMFDPKDDDKTLVHDKWTKVEDDETLAELISWIKMNRDYYPWLWRILGPDDQFYGYMYTGWRQAVTKAVDAKTLWVYDLPVPLRYQFREDPD
ncbi:MAG: hypothetical protein MUO52_14350 [Desulfobacterales bacterium]|nr:hypothetical protein [Desulfobacterales bacterium]